MADQWYTFGAGFLLVYSITDRPTFDSIASFHQDILRMKDRVYVPCVVVCNKVGRICSTTVGTLRRASWTLAKSRLWVRQGRYGSAGPDECFLAHELTSMAKYGGGWRLGGRKVH
jgi:hypothetical protein